jgi:type IV secretory pathway VirB3-like protein
MMTTILIIGGVVTVLIMACMLIAMCKIAAIADHRLTQISREVLETLRKTMKEQV